MIDADDSFGVETKGLSLRDDDGNIVGYFTTHAGDPTGTPAPVNTFVFREDTQLVWYKFGAGDNDWRQVRSQDILMDVTGIEDDSPDLAGNTTVFDTLTDLANRVYGSFFGIGRFNNVFQTNSGLEEDALVVNIPNARSGRYVMYWSYRANNSKSNTSNITRANFNDAAVSSNTVNGKDSILGGGLGEQFSGFSEFSILDLANLKLSLTIERTAGNGNAWISRMNLMGFRINI